VSDDAQRLTIDNAGEGREIILVLAGEIDPHTAPELENEVSRVLGADADRLVFDLERVRFIDSSGLRVFISTHREVTERGGTFALRSPSETTVRLLEVTGLDSHIDVEP
jgi:anti-anti-sigma factor